MSNFLAFQLCLNNGCIKISNNIQQIPNPDKIPNLSSISSILNTPTKTGSVSFSSMNTLQFKEYIEKFYPSIICQKLFNELEKKRQKIVEILNQNLARLKNGFYNGVNSVRMNSLRSNFDKSLYFYEMQNRFESELLFWENQCSLFCHDLIISTVENYRGNVFESTETSRKRSFIPISSQRVLHEWMLENCQNPYPSKEEKRILMEKSGLTKKQTNNWLINNRIRIWKPIMQQINKKKMGKSTCISKPKSKSKEKYEKK